MNVRDWIIHVEDHCAAIVAVLFEGKLGSVHDFGCNSEMPNLETVKLILDRLGKPQSLISFVTDRGSATIAVMRSTHPSPSGN